MPEGWRATPAGPSPSIWRKRENSGSSLSVVTPPENPAKAEAEVVVTAGGRQMSAGVVNRLRTHSDPDPRAGGRLEFVRVDARNLARHVGYIMGAGDEVPEALRQFGVEVTLLDEAADSRVVICPGSTPSSPAFAPTTCVKTSEPTSAAARLRQAGGTLMVQYNVVGRGPGGADILAGHRSVSDRVSAVTASVSRKRRWSSWRPDDPVLQFPNRITAADFAGWIQERGLYFADQWDRHYKPLFSSHDPGEDPLAGSTLYTRYGNGVFVFTGPQLLPGIAGRRSGRVPFIRQFPERGADGGQMSEWPELPTVKEIPEIHRRFSVRGAGFTCRPTLSRRA